MAAYTVSQVNTYVKSLLDNSAALRSVTVKGEITNLSSYTGGHLYFSIKDEYAQLRVVMFQGNASRLKFQPTNGMKVIIDGSISVYTKQGVYQLTATNMQPDGVGALYLAYEQLKTKLQQQGLFDPEYKKPIPTMPKKVGVITSATGAAVHDIVTITGRRWASAEIYIYPATVQGDNAEQSLIKALDFFESKFKVDVIIIGRGGGSMEDLWCFNSENLAYKIFQASTPIVSAVGHETDFTICDFVADKRAPTPSAAAELIVPDAIEVQNRVNAISDSLLKWFAGMVSGKRNDCIFAESRLRESFNRLLMLKRHKLELAVSQIEAVNPVAILSRGYSLVQKGNAIVKDIHELKPDDQVSIKVNGGVAEATINAIKEDA